MAKTKAILVITIFAVLLVGVGVILAPQVTEGKSSSLQIQLFNGTDPVGTPLSWNSIPFMFLPQTIMYGGEEVTGLTVHVEAYSNDPDWALLEGEIWFKIVYSVTTDDGIPLTHTIPSEIMESFTESKSNTGGVMWDSATHQLDDLAEGVPNDTAFILQIWGEFDFYSDASSGTGGSLLATVISDPIAINLSKEGYDYTANVGATPG